MEELTYSTVELCRLTGASYRQVDYWARTRSLVPLIDARGSGTQRRWALRHVYMARVLWELSRLGADSPVLRSVAALLDAAPTFDGKIVVDADGIIEPLSDDTIAGWLVDLDACMDHVDDKAEAEGILTALT